MRACIFGVGFIGTATGNKLVRDGWDVFGFDNWLVDPEVKQAFHVGNCDVRNQIEIEHALKTYMPHVVFWFPARQGYSEDYSSFSDVQINGTYAFFEALDKTKDVMGLERIVLASSQAIYSPDYDVTEDSEKSPPSVYGFSKLQQERAFSWFCLQRGIPLIALRYSIVLGAGQALQSTESGLLRNWYHKWQANEAPEVYGDGLQLRDFVSIEDVVSANLLAAKHPKTDVFNIGGTPAAISVMAEEFERITGCKKSIITGRSHRPGGEYSLTSSSKRATEVLGWDRWISPVGCMGDFLDSVKENGQTGGD